MELRRPETLRHNPELGEVDPRSYPLLCLVRLKTQEVGSNSRSHEASQLCYVVDRLMTSLGEPRARVHLTAAPGRDPKDAIEIRVQLLTVPTDKVAEVVEEALTKVNLVAEAGARIGFWEVLKSEG
jgi:hypothetical protein